jgi:(1->4)-alpha-D-glucan 1-alpha-D-glucosylmutase
VGDAGLAKLLVVSRALRLRCDRPGAFGPGGAYEPLPVEAHEDGTDLVVAHTRGGEVAVVVPRLTLRHPLARRTARLTLPPGRWDDILVDGRTLEGEVAVADLLAPFPVALLARRGDR